MGGSASKEIKEAKKTREYSLAGRGLREIPKDIKVLSKNLLTLDCSDNKLTGLPPEIGKEFQFRFIFLKLYLQKSHQNLSFTLILLSFSIINLYSFLF